MDKVVVMQKLSDAKELLRQYGVNAVGLFGLTARVESRQDSDIDILIWNLLRFISTGSHFT